MQMLWTPFHVLSSTYRQSHSLQFRLELCQLNVKHRQDEINRSAASLHSGKRAPKFQHRNHTERGIKPWIESLPETPQFIQPLWFQVPPMFQGEALKLMDHKRGKDEIKSELHQLTPMTHARLCYATLLQYVLLQCYRNSFNTHC